MKKRQDILVYVAGPLTGDVNENVRNAMQVGTELLMEGIDVFIPHLNAFIERFWEEEGYPQAKTSDSDESWGYDEWLDYDFAILSRCDALFRMEGDSPGADMEVAFAKGRGIPIFHSLFDLRGWVGRGKVKIVKGFNEADQE